MNPSASYRPSYSRRSISLGPSGPTFRRASSLSPTHRPVKEYDPLNTLKKSGPLAYKAKYGPTSSPEVPQPSHPPNQTPQNSVKLASQSLTTTRPSITSQSPTAAQLPIVIQSPTTIQSPVVIQTPATVHPPSATQSPTTVKPPIKMQSPIPIQKPLRTQGRQQAFFGRVFRRAWVKIVRLRPRTVAPEQTNGQPEPKPLASGRYKIQNLQSRAFAALRNSDSYSEMIASFPRLGLTSGDMWEVEWIAKSRYIIRNVDHATYAGPPGASPSEGENVSGKDTPTQWEIKELRQKGRYLISPSISPDLLWNHGDDEHGTPLTLQFGPTDPRNQWVFVPVQAP